MQDWKKYKIADIGEVVGGATPSTSNEEYYGDDISWITPKDLSDFKERYIFCGERSITKLGLDSCSSRMLPTNSVLFSSRAPIGYIAIAGRALCTNQGFKSVVPNEKIDYMFLYYLLVYRKNEIEALGSGTTFKEVSGSVLKSFEIYMPKDIEDQRAIAAMLSCLDDKIELTNRINKNLEEMAQSIFKRWFVNFEFPNEDGQPYKSSGGSMVDSELGEIPQGWRVTKIEDVCDINSQQYSTNDNWDYINYLDTSSITANVIENYQFLRTATDKVPSRAKRKVIAGDIVYSTVRPIQRHYGIIKKPPCNLIASTGFAVIHSNNSNICTEQVYLNLINENTVEKLQQIAETTTSTFPAIKPSDISSLPIICADNLVGKKFEGVLSPIFDTIGENNLQNQTLAAIRDALLPKLMSGEIRVKGV